LISTDDDEPKRTYLNSTVDKLSAVSAILRVLEFLALVLGAFLLLGAIFHQLGISFHSEGAEEGLSTFANSAFLCLIVLAAAAVAARLEGRPILGYGLSDRKWGWRCASGLLTGLVLLGVLVGSLFLFGFISFRPNSVGMIQTALWGLFWAGTYMVVSIAEECLFRGYLLSSLTRAFGFTAAAIVSSILFAAAHLANGFESPMAAINAGLLGGVFAMSVRRTGSLWWAIGMHAGWDWAESFASGAADSGIRSAGRIVTASPHGPTLLSGGLAGPEGSALMLLPIALAAVACCISFRSTGSASPKVRSRL
jgi:membrane protease YdiL (CAAX protease family)